MLTKIQALRALRARLSLDREMGAEYLAAGSFDPGQLEEMIKSVSHPVPVRKVLSDTARHFAAPAVSARPAQPPAPPRPAALVPASGPGPVPAYIVPAFPPAAVNPEKEAALASLREKAMHCEDCGLCAKRNSVVWGEGSLDAAVMFIGEGPGRDEDREGRPFVGRSGRVLTDIIEKGMKAPRGEVYIANVVKCRPPGNRDPKPEETAACAQYLTKQIEVIGPRVIVAVGGVAGCALLRLPPKTGGLRGKWHEYEGVPLRVIYHPSYLLRQRRTESDRTQADREVWKDIMEVMEKLEG